MERFVGVEENGAGLVVELVEELEQQAMEDVLPVVMRPPSELVQD